MADFIDIPEYILITFYTLANYPPSILGFVVCVSLISSIIILKKFNKETYLEKLFLIEGVSLTMFFIIPIVATIILLISLIFGLTLNIPTEIRISKFLEDLILFSAILSILTLTLNIATQRILQSGIVIQKRGHSKPQEIL